MHHFYNWKKAGLNWY